MTASHDSPSGVHNQEPENNEVVLRRAAGAVRANHESPALVSGASMGADAFEMKCLVSEEIAAGLGQFLQKVLHPDPFAAAAPGGHYRITTLSTDTSELNCFHRSPGYASRKYRIRRYGDESQVYLERKVRRGNRVRKHRIAVSTDAFLGLVQEPPQSTQSTAETFLSQIHDRRLQPVCLMSYERTAWFGESENGAVRWTLDRNLCGELMSRWDVNRNGGATAILASNTVICEFKFCGALPQIFKAAIRQFDLVPGGFSKYRNCMTALTGLTPEISTQLPPAADQSLPDQQTGEPGHA